MEGNSVVINVLKKAMFGRRVKTIRHFIIMPEFFGIYARKELPGFFEFDEMSLYLQLEFIFLH
jgi:hypothetical protein